MPSKICQILFLITFAAAGCARHGQQSSATTRPATPRAGEAIMATDSSTAPADGKSKESNGASGGKFTHAKSGIELTYPAGWEKQQKEGYELTIVPAGASGGPERWISLDVPDLPMHVPGMIPISRVEGGYLDDLRKNYGKVDIKELTPPSVPQAKLRMVRVAWQKDSQNMQQTAVLMVHDDHVYILRARSDVDHEQPTREAFDSIVSSIHWLGKK